MAGSLDSLGPSYISAHSADVILSEIRPTKLKIEALHSINVFLDEFLFNILKNAGSLLTDNLRASLLSLLPTTLGKEALLEAEVELRAYWDRTAAPDPGALEDDSKAFHLQWAFELLRLKCEAYSTLNEFDEDKVAENRIHDRMSATGGIPPKVALISPAALYLTAILEHILSNVGRVVARDSSRTNAIAQDLFIALCEDHTIYDLFKKMKVYEQIEQLSKVPRQDMSSAQDPSPEVSITTTNPGSIVTSNSGFRPSFEKTRAMKMFKANSRSSIDGNVPNGHKRSSSSVSEKDSRHTATLIDDSTYENDALQQEFDDLMRSSSTMKVSLTPDRLKTMEVYKQEKESGNRQLDISESGSSPPVAPRAAGRRPSLLHRVDSIKEDEEESGTKPVPLPSTRNRQASVSSRPTTAPVSSRARSVSTSSSTTALRFFTKASHISTPVPVAPTIVDQSFEMQKHRHITKVQDPSLPPRTRKVQRNRESLDLDEVMAGSDDDAVLFLAPAPKFSARPATPKHNGQNPSANTRDLINFLAEGPPDMGGPVSDITADGPPYGTSQNGKSKGTGRLQRMISKLSLGNGDRSRGTDDVSRSPARQAKMIPSQLSLNNPLSLANRPVPPRPPPAPRPISPPESPHDSSEEHSYTDSRSRSASIVQRKPTLDSSNHLGPVSVPTVPSSSTQREHSGSVSSSRRLQPHSHEIGPVQQSSDVKIQQHINANRHTQPQRQRTIDIVQTVGPPPRIVSAQKPDSHSSPIPSKVQSRSQVTSPTPPASPQRKPPPVYVDPSTQPHITHEDVLHMRRLFSKATTADECRLILDMFLARAGVLDPRKFDVPHPPARDQTADADPRLQATLLELLLGGESATATNSESNLTQEYLQSETLAVETPRGSGTENRRSPIVDNEEPVTDCREPSFAQQEAARFARNHTPVGAGFV
ncbi:hypothetical protein C0995_011140 [Termitomyces sp. Mi166|nr:hypothetical protein C0995_011140 [Termitomyces sp. Mi166\